MKYLFRVSTGILFISLLLSNLVLALPSGFDAYFDITNDQGETLIISIKKNKNINLVDTPDWARVLFDDIERNGALMITVDNSRSFTIGHDTDSVDFNNGTPSLRFYLPDGYPDIHMPTPVLANAEEPDEITNAERDAVCEPAESNQNSAGNHASINAPGPDTELEDILEEVDISERAVGGEPAESNQNSADDHVSIDVSDVLSADTMQQITCLLLQARQIVREDMLISHSQELTAPLENQFQDGVDVEFTAIVGLIPVINMSICRRILYCIISPWVMPILLASKWLKNKKTD